MGRLNTVQYIGGLTTLPGLEGSRDLNDARSILLRPEQYTDGDAQPVYERLDESLRLIVERGGVDAEYAEWARDNLADRWQQAGFTPLTRQERAAREAYTAMSDEDLIAASRDDTLRGTLAEFVGEQLVNRGYDPDTGQPSEGSAPGSAPTRCRSARGRFTCSAGGSP